MKKKSVFYRIIFYFIQRRIEKYCNSFKHNCHDCRFVRKMRNYAEFEEGVIDYSDLIVGCIAEDFENRFRKII